MQQRVLLSALALSLASGTSSAFYKFEINLVNAGTLPGDGGSPLTWTHPTSAAPYNNLAVSGVFGPTADLIDVQPKARWDSYLGMDPLGPSDGGTVSSGDGYNTNTDLTTTSPATGFTDSGTSASIQGGWLSNTFIRSTSSPFGNRIFLAQLSLRPGSSVPTTAGLIINLRTIIGSQPDAAASGLVKFGIFNASNNGGAWAQPYYLRLESIPISGLNDTFNGGQCYKLYLYDVQPTPGATAIAALVGLTALQRRRR